MTPAQSILAAASAGNLRAVAELLDSDGDLVNAAGDDEVTLLHLATRAGNLRLAHLLINRGADLDACDVADHAGPLLTAVKLARVDFVELLLDAGADPRRPDRTGQTPLQSAHRGKAGEWKTLAPDACEADYDAIIELIATYCDECAAESEF